MAETAKRRRQYHSAPFLGARRTILLATAAWVALPRTGLVRAQAPGASDKPVRIGILTTGSSTGTRIGTERYVEPMRDLGWIEGRNVVYDRVYAERDAQRLPALAAALVARKPDIVLVTVNGELRAMLAVTRTIPIVFSSVLEPVEFGFVASLARPGGNVTGVASLGPEFGSKRMQLLKEVLPKVSRVGVLVGRRTKREIKLIEDAAGAGIRVIPAIAAEASELDAAFAALAQNQVEALLLAQVALYAQRPVWERIVGFAAEQRIPVIGQRPDIVDGGALMSYSSILSEQVRRATQIADKVLKGAKPADIPVEQPTQFELVLNLRTAKALGLTIPQSVLIQATRVIE